jgi:hypothetical protein
MLYAKRYIITKHVMNDDFVVSPDAVCDVIKSLKLGKSTGSDYLSAEHLIHPVNPITILLSIIFASCIVFDHLPSDVMKMAII